MKITIDISDDKIVSEFAKARGYLAVDPLTKKPNDQTEEEFVKGLFVKDITNTVARLRTKQAVKDVISDVATIVEAKIS